MNRDELNKKDIFIFRGQKHMATNHAWFDAINLETGELVAIPEFAELEKTEYEIKFVRYGRF